MKPLKILIKGFSSTITSGTERAYLNKLLLKSNRIFKPSNVIDNKYFMDKAINNKEEENTYYAYQDLLKKNHKILLKAFEEYKKNGGTLGLILIGGGLIKKDYAFKEYLKKYEKITIIDFLQIDELINFYKIASISVPNIIDQWGLVVNKM